MRVGYAVSPRADGDIDEIAEYLAKEAGLDKGKPDRLALPATPSDAWQAAGFSRESPLRKLPDLLPAYCEGD